MTAKKTIENILKEKDIIRCREYVSHDCYAYVIRNKKTGKLLISEWFVDEAEKKLKELLL